MKTTCIRLWLLFIAYSQTLSASNFSFYLECPPNVTIQCTDDVSNLDKWGQAYIWSNNKRTPAPPPKTTIYNTNACGIGTITRTWEVEDPYWKIHSCSQIITVTGSVLFTGNDIAWPRDTTLEGCNPNADPRSFSYPNGYPRFNRVKCAQAMYSYKDTKFTVSAGCMKIIREWKVIDWCQYVPNKYPAVGQWSYFQIIKLIVSDTGMVLSCPRDTMVESKLDCKGSYVKLDSAKAFSKCGNALSIRNTSPYSKTKGPDASGDYPLGTTEFYYIAEYGCGKETKCKVRVTVTNKIGPVPYCLNGLVVALMPVDTNRDGTPDDGMVEIWAKDFNIGSYHPCGYKKLYFSFSSDTAKRSQVFTCADLGKNEIRMYVTDSLGNQSFCKTYIEIQNNNARIPDCKRKDSILTTTVSIAGAVFEPDGDACAGMDILLKGPVQRTITLHTDTLITVSFDTVIGKSGTVFYIRRNDTSFVHRSDTTYQQWESSLQSDANGRYAFKDLGLNKDYTLSLDKRESEFQGININDAIVLLKHLSGAEQLTDPYKLLAADINGDLVVSQADFDLLYQLVTGKLAYESLPLHWRIIRKPFLFANPLNPFANPLEATVQFPKLQNNFPQLNFTAIRIGELDGFSGLLNTLEDRGAADQTSQSPSMMNLKVYPNPLTQPRVLFSFEMDHAATINIQLMNSQMQVLKSISRSFDKGLQHWAIEVDELNLGGLLLYSFSDGSTTQFGKLICSK